METMSNITLVLFFIAIILSRYINSMAIKKLTTEKKAQLLDTFSGFSVWSVLPLLVLMGIFYFSIDFITGDRLFYLFYIFIFLMVGYVIGLQVYIFKKLHKLDYPMNYIKQYMLSVFFRFVGLIILVLPMGLVFLGI